MDPNEALRVLREWAGNEDPADQPPTIDADAVDAFRALDQWLSRGGFLPSAWVRPATWQGYAS